MFLKIFLAFWLTVGLFAAAQEAAARLSRNQEQRILGQARAIVADARDIPAAYEQRGAAGAREAASAFARRNGLFADLLRRDRTSVSGRAVRPAESAAARLADRVAAAGYSEAAVVPADHLAAKQVSTAGGERLTLLVELPRTTTTLVSQALLISAPVRLVVILAIGGVVSLAVARHLAYPVVRLRAAADALAEGRLQARAGPESGVRRDELGALARDFDRMAGRIEALVAGQRRLLGDVSHELRSPLTRLTLALSLAREHAAPAAEEYFARIDREARRLDRLIEQLLMLARLESGVVDQRTPFDLATVVEEVVADGDFEARALGKAVALRASEPAWIVGSAELVRSAVENVVRNAIRHGPPGVPVDVLLSVDDGALAHVVVRDRGPGVDPAMLRELFKPFWRTRGGDDQAPPEGAGLGLAISERIVRMHDGRIRAANAAGGGLMVAIDLPGRASAAMAVP